MNKTREPLAINPAVAPAERMASSLIKLGKDGKIKFLAGSAHALMGVHAGAVQGKALASADLPEEVRSALRQLLRESDEANVSTGSASSKEARFILRVDGDAHHFLATAFAEDADNFSVVIQDVSPYLQALSGHDECLLREKQWRQHAEATARARDQFLSVVSHELRSPLNGIQSWAHVLESQIDTDKPIVQRALAGIKTGVTQQVLLIEALLDATQILNGQFQLMQQPYSLNGAIQAALDELRSEAEQKRISMVFTPGVADIDMVGDVERIQQVFRQLLSNAIKFTDDNGDVLISVSRGENAAEISFEDNGIGIAPAFGASIFEPFRQQDSSQTRRAAGLGLGLAVSRRVAELHGGSLNFESEGVGRGSTFRVVLPLTTA